MHEPWRIAADTLIGLGFAAIVLATGAAARALILAWTRPPRHALHTTAADERIVPAQPGMLRQPSEDDVSEWLAALPPWETRERPAPGETIYTDHSVWLPQTPAAPPRPHAWATPPVEPGPPVVADITTAPPRHDDSPRRVPPGCTTCGSYSHWTDGHDTATSKLHAEPVTTTDLAVPDSTFVRALLALPLSRVYEAFEGARQ